MKFVELKECEMLVTIVPFVAFVTLLLIVVFGMFVLMEFADEYLSYNKFYRCY